MIDGMLGFVNGLRRLWKGMCARIDRTALGRLNEPRRDRHQDDAKRES
jgi:hypothetical protein